jgi:hypothetical protein
MVSRKSALIGMVACFAGGMLLMDGLSKVGAEDKVEAPALSAPSVQQPVEPSTPQVSPDAGPPPSVAEGYTLFDAARDNPLGAELLPGMTQVESDAVSLFRDACATGFSERSRDQMSQMAQWLATNHPEALTKADTACGQTAVGAGE